MTTGSLTQRDTPPRQSRWAHWAAAVIVRQALLTAHIGNVDHDVVRLRALYFLWGIVSTNESASVMLFSNQCRLSNKHMDQ